MKNYILIAPHPDDELVNMSHFLFKKNSSAILICGSDIVRRNKFISLMEYLKKDYKIRNVLPDYLLTYDKKLIYNLLKLSIIELSRLDMDNILVIPSSFDTHPEHMLVGLIANRIAMEFNMKSIIYSTCSNNEETKVESPHKEKFLKKYYESEYKELVESKYLNGSIETYTEIEIC